MFAYSHACTLKVRVKKVRYFQAWARGRCYKNGPWFTICPGDILKMCTFQNFVTWVVKKYVNVCTAFTAVKIFNYLTINVNLIFIASTPFPGFGECENCG
jgi:hypothetical protein